MSHGDFMKGVDLWIEGKGYPYDENGAVQHGYLTAKAESEQATQYEKEQRLTHYSELRDSL
tara:strand:+ start:169 stop:351 length:183 start_codon:yes stop_codon:yes gene_type:complete